MYHCSGSNYLTIRSSDTGEPLSIADLERGRGVANTLTSEIVVFGNGSVDISLLHQGWPRPFADVKFSTIVGFTTILQDIIFVSETSSRQYFKLFNVSISTETIKHIYTLPKGDKSFMRFEDISVYKGPVYFLLTSISLYRITPDGESRVLSENLALGQHLIAVSQTEVFLTRKSIQDDDRAGKLLYINSESNHEGTVEVCHSRHNLPGVFQGCGITDPRFLVPVNSKQLIIVDENLQFKLLTFEFVGKYHAVHARLCIY